LRELEPEFDALMNGAENWQRRLFDYEASGCTPTAFEKQAQQLIADLQLCLAHSVLAEAAASPAPPTLLEKIQSRFSTFGGEQGGNDSTNPLTHALKGQRLIFALGVDVEEVVRFVLSETALASSGVGIDPSEENEVPMLLEQQRRESEAKAILFAELLRYTSHRDGCAFFGVDRSYCTCGLQDARTALMRVLIPTDAAALGMGIGPSEEQDHVSSIHAAERFTGDGRLAGHSSSPEAGPASHDEGARPGADLGDRESGQSRTQGTARSSVASRRADVAGVGIGSPRPAEPQDTYPWGETMPQYAALGIGAEAWVELEDIERRGIQQRNNDRSGMSINWRTFVLVMKVLRAIRLRHFSEAREAVAPRPAEQEKS
jgi:hypothetical protein